MNNITREELEVRKGVVWGCMTNAYKSQMKEIIGDERGYFFDAEHSKWDTTSPSWFDDFAYFPTDEQLDRYYAPKNEFEVGSVWYNATRETVIQIEAVNDNWIEHKILFTATRYCMIGFMKGSKFDKQLIPFYAPPRQVFLDEQCKEIDCIGIAEKGDRVYHTGCMYTEKVGYGPGKNPNPCGCGYVYILKDKEHEEPNKTTVAAIEESREMDKDSETERMWVINRNPEEVDLIIVKGCTSMYIMNDDGKTIERIAI